MTSIVFADIEADLHNSNCSESQYLRQMRTLRNFYASEGEIDNRSIQSEFLTFLSQSIEAKLSSTSEMNDKIIEASSQCIANLLQRGGSSQIIGWNTFFPTLLLKLASIQKPNICFAITLSVFCSIRDSNEQILKQFSESGFQLLFTLCNACSFFEEEQMRQHTQQQSPQSSSSSSNDNTIQSRCLSYITSIIHILAQKSILWQMLQYNSRSEQILHIIEILEAMMHTPENEQHTDEDKADQLLPTQIDRQSLINIFIEYFNIGIKEGFTLSQVKKEIVNKETFILLMKNQQEKMLYHSVVFQPPQFGRRVVDVGNVQQPISYEQWRYKQKNIDDKEKYQLNIQSTTKIEIIDKNQYWPQIGFKRLNEQSSSSSLQPSSTIIPPLLEQGYRTLLLKTLGNLCYSTIEGPQHIRQINAFPLILTLTNYDDSNPFMREAAIWTMRNATLGNKENSDLVASMTSSGSIRTDLGIDEQSIDPEIESDIKDEKEVIQSK